MKPRIKVLTLAVSDLERSLAFYRDGLGLPTQGVIGQEFEDGAVVFFHLNDDLILALYPATSLGKDARITATGTRLGAVSIGHVVGSKEAVDAVMAEALRAGAIDVGTRALALDVRFGAVDELPHRGFGLAEDGGDLRVTLVESGVEQERCPLFRGEALEHQ